MAGVTLKLFLGWLVVELSAHSLLRNSVRKTLPADHRTNNLNAIFQSNNSNLNINDYMLRVNILHWSHITQTNRKQSFENKIKNREIYNFEWRKFREANYFISASQWIIQGGQGVIIFLIWICFLWCIALLHKPYQQLHQNLLSLIIHRHYHHRLFLCLS